MSQHVDESVDQDLLLAFSTEPGGKPPDSTETLGARVECLERALQRSASHVDSLKSEVATLVGAIEDITRQFAERKAPESSPPSRRRSNLVPAIAGIILGVVLGVSGWLTWSRDSIDTLAAAPAPVSENRRVEPPVTTPVETPAETLSVVVAAAAAPVRARPQPARVVTETEPEVARAPVDYVGSLSIDASPGGRVFINRRAAGETPLRIPNLKAGSHLVWIERDGYRRFTRVVHVPADRVSRVWADLEPLPVR